MSFSCYGRLGICFLILVDMWLVLWKSYVDYSEKVPEFLRGSGGQAAILKGLWDSVEPVFG